MAKHNRRHWLTGLQTESRPRPASSYRGFRLNGLYGKRYGPGAIYRPVRNYSKAYPYDSVKRRNPV